MGFLAPALLALGIGVAVPLLLHLLRHGERIRVVFPALQYLHRTEREHARRIRTRQVLLLLLRCAVVVVIAAAAARPFLVSGSDSHEPTAVALVIDNSLSSGRVIGDGRVLDTLIAAARTVLDRAGPDDRFWVFPAAEPWTIAVPGPASAARAALAGIEAVDASADLPATVARARGIVEAAGMPAAEVHLMTDLQATQFGSLEESAPRAPTSDDAAPVLVFSPALPGFANRTLHSVLVNGGLAPIAGRPVEVSAVLSAGPDGSETAVATRLLVDGEVRSVLRVVPPASATFELPPPAAGERLAGVIELDPDPLRADDRQYFSTVVRHPPATRLPRSSPFLAAALEVLAEAGRISITATDAEVLFLEGAEAPPAGGTGRIFVIEPPTDPTLLPALNRRMEQLGVGWRFAPPRPEPGTALTLPPEMSASDTVRVWSRNPLGRVASGAEGDVVARTADGLPWMIRGGSGGDRWVVLGSPMRPDASSLPISASLYPVLEWILDGAGDGAGPGSISAGSPFGTPPGADAVRTPSGERFPTDGTRIFRRTATAGLYEVLAAEEVLTVVAVNPSDRESDPEALAPAALEGWFGEGTPVVSDFGDWAGEVFVVRRGNEFTSMALIAVLAILVVESLVASSGARSTRSAVAPGGGHARTSPDPA